jgi:hypothetical protein
MKRAIVIISAAALLLALSVFSWRQTAGQTKPSAAKPSTKVDGSKPITKISEPVLTAPPLPTPCDDMVLYQATVVRNNKPAQQYFGAPEYYGKISLDGTAWNVKVPAEAYDLSSPYLIRFIIRTVKYWPVVYHPALKVLTKAQAESLGYISSNSAAGSYDCFVKVTTPDGSSVASMYENIPNYSVHVTDDWPAEVTLGGQYGMELWYFKPDGVFTKKGSYTIKMGTCEAKPDDRFVCK